VILLNSAVESQPPVRANGPEPRLRVNVSLQNEIAMAASRPQSSRPAGAAPVSQPSRRGTPYLAGQPARGDSPEARILKPFRFSANFLKF
jgi:hypothetical protein